MKTRNVQGILDVLGRKIFLKVLTNNRPIDEANNSFLLVLPDLPGYDHQASLALVERLKTQAKASNLNMPHVVLFDFPGCGQSQIAADPAKEYTIDHFTTVTAFVIEYVKKQFCHDSALSLTIHGGALGSVIAMNLPLIRPLWTDKNANIRIKQIVSCGGIHQPIDSHYCTQFLFSRFFHHRDYEKMLNAIRKLSLGDIKDRDDYISNIALPLAALMSTSYANTSLTYTGSMLCNYPAETIAAMRALSYVGSLLGRDTSAIDTTVSELTSVSLDVMKFFFSREFAHINMKALAEKNASLFSKLQLTFMTGNDDILANQVDTLILQKQLPQSTAIILHDRHQTLDPNKQATLDNILLSLFCKNYLDMSILKNNDFVAFTKVPDSLVKKQGVERSKVFSQASSDLCFKQLGVNKATLGSNTTRNDKKEKQPVLSSAGYEPVNVEVIEITHTRRNKK